MMLVVLGGSVALVAFLIVMAQRARSLKAGGDPAGTPGRAPGSASTWAPARGRPSPAPVAVIAGIAVVGFGGLAVAAWFALARSPAPAAPAPPVVPEAPAPTSTEPPVPPAPSPAPTTEAPPPRAEPSPPVAQRPLPLPAPPSAAEESKWHKFRDLGFGVSLPCERVDPSRERFHVTTRKRQTLRLDCTAIEVVLQDPARTYWAATLVLTPDMGTTDEIFSMVQAALAERWKAQRADPKALATKETVSVASSDVAGGKGRLHVGLSRSASRLYVVAGRRPREGRGYRGDPGVPRVVRARSVTVLERCAYCGKPAPAEADRCPHCGASSGSSRGGRLRAARPPSGRSAAMRGSTRARRTTGSSSSSRGTSSRTRPSMSTPSRASESPSPRPSLRGTGRSSTSSGVQRTRAAAAPSSPSRTPRRNRWPGCSRAVRRESSSSSRRCSGPAPSGASRTRSRPPPLEVSSRCSVSSGTLSGDDLTDTPEVATEVAEAASKLGLRRLAIMTGAWNADCERRLAEGLRGARSLECAGVFHKDDEKTWPLIDTPLVRAAVGHRASRR